MGAAEPAIGIALAADNNYAAGVLVSLASALAHTPSDIPVEVVVLDEGLSPGAVAMIRRTVWRVRAQCLVHIVESQMPHDLEVPTSGHLSQAAYARLRLPSACPHLDLALYIDADTLTRSDLGDLLAEVRTTGSAAAVRDRSAPTFRRRLAFGPLPDGVGLDDAYVNTGVLAFRLDRWRKGQLTEGVMEVIRVSGNQLRFHDQDAINIRLASEIGLLHSRWNYQVRAERRLDNPAPLLEAAIVHFNDPEKPWDSLDWVRADPILRRASLAWWRFALFSRFLPFAFRLRMAQRLLSCSARLCRQTLARRSSRLKVRARPRQQRQR